MLLKHKWNEERSRDELLSLDPEQAEINKSVNNPRFQNQYIDMLKKNLNGAVNGAINRASAINYANVKKKKTKRRGSDAGSDSDFDNHHQKDDKVFDRFVAFAILHTPNLQHPSASSRKSSPMHLLTLDLDGIQCFVLLLTGDEK